MFLDLSISSRLNTLLQFVKRYKENEEVKQMKKHDHVSFNEKKGNQKDLLSELNKVKWNTDFSKNNSPDRSEDVESSFSENIVSRMKHLTLRYLIIQLVISKIESFFVKKTILNYSTENMSGAFKLSY